MTRTIALAIIKIIICVLLIILLTIKMPKAYDEGVRALFCIAIIITFVYLVYNIIVAHAEYVSNERFKDFSI